LAIIARSQNFILKVCLLKFCRIIKSSYVPYSAPHTHPYKIAFISHIKIEGQANSKIKKDTSCLLVENVSFYLTFVKVV
jgi:hypothetical protein